MKFAVIGSIVPVLLVCEAQSVDKSAKYDPAGAIRPIRALLAVSEEPVMLGSSCDERRLDNPKPGPPRVEDLLAVLLAYHDSGLNEVKGSCGSGEIKIAR